MAETTPNDDIKRLTDIFITELNEDIFTEAINDISIFKQFEHRTEGETKTNIERLQTEAKTYENTNVDKYDILKRKFYNFEQSIINFRKKMRDQGKTSEIDSSKFIEKLKEIKKRFDFLKDAISEYRVIDTKMINYDRKMDEFKSVLDELLKKYKIVDTSRFISDLTDSLKQSLRQNEIETIRFVKSLKDALQQSMNGDQVDSSKFVGLFKTALESSIKSTAQLSMQTSGFVNSLTSAIQSSLNPNEITTTDFVSSLTSALSTSIHKTSKESIETSTFVSNLKTAIQDSITTKKLDTSKFVDLLTKQIQGSFTTDKINTSKFVVSLTDGIQKAIKGKQINTEGFVNKLTDSIQSAIKAKEINTSGFVSELTKAIKGSIGTKKIDTTNFVNNLKTAIQSSITSKKIDTIPFVTSLTKQLNSAIKGNVIDTTDFVTSLTTALQKSIKSKPINTVGFVDSLTTALTKSIRTKEIDTTKFVTSLTGALQNSIRKKEIDTKQFVSKLANGIQAVINKANPSLASRVSSGISSISKFGKYINPVNLFTRKQTVAQGQIRLAPQVVKIPTIKEIKSNENSITVNGSLKGFKGFDKIEIGRQTYGRGDTVQIDRNTYTIVGFEKVSFLGGRRTLKKGMKKGGLFDSKVKIILDRTIPRAYPKGTEISIIPTRDSRLQRDDISEASSRDDLPRAVIPGFTRGRVNSNGSELSSLRYFPGRDGQDRYRQDRYRQDRYRQDDDTSSTVSSLTDQEYTDRAGRGSIQQPPRGNIISTGVNQIGSVGQQNPPDISSRIDAQDEKIRILQQQIDTLRGTSASSTSNINPQQISATIKSIDDVLSNTKDIEIQIDGKSEYYDRFGNLQGSSTNPTVISSVNSAVVEGVKTVPEALSFLDMTMGEIGEFIQKFIEKIKDPKVSQKVIEIFQILDRNIDKLKDSEHYETLAQIIKTILEKILGHNEFDGSDYGDEESDDYQESQEIMTNRTLGINPKNPNSTKEFVENLTAYLQESLDASKSFPDKLAEKLEEVFRSRGILEE